MKKWVVVLLLFAGCSGRNRHADISHETLSPNEKLARGIKHLEGAKYEEALDYFEQYLNENPVTDSTVNATFYSGLALEGLNRYTEAEQKFRTTLRLSEGRDAYMEAESLFQLGKTLEGQGDDAKALATYLDTDKRSKPLRRETAEVELPARIAAIYSRQLRPEVAEKYYKRAERALNKLRGKGKAPEWFPRSLYSMGKMSPRSITESDFDTGLKGMRRSQNYLLRSVESDHPIWSAKAEKELESIYDSAWRVIETYPLLEAEDRLMALKAQQNRMIEMGLILHGVMMELKQDFLPGEEDSNLFVAQLQDYLDGYTKRLEALLATRPVNEGLTPEGQRLESLRREGRVVDPAGILEQSKKALPETAPNKKEKK